MTSPIRPEASTKEKPNINKFKPNVIKIKPNVNHIINVGG